MLKIIAAFLMVIDHIGVVFLPSSSSLYILCRLLGRISMPLFAYQLVAGFRYTRHFPKYLTRIAIMTVFAQIPFTWLRYGRIVSPSLTHWNIGLTFLCALLILERLAKLSTFKDLLTLSYLPDLLLIIFLLLIGRVGDYGSYGILTVVIFYYYQKGTLSLKQCSFLLTLLCLIYLPTIGTLQIFSLFSLVVIKETQDIPVKLPKNFFYFFYPAHMFLLVILKSVF